uniref:SMODS and SLOG-associating 2TM effector domain-containing protein n=1 Tax=viral metagenome TaxID=1070528 RepID=A0A6C0L7N8_9ZZZZ
MAEEKHDADIEGTHISWHANIDTLLAKWCDSAKCYEWMHSESHSSCEKSAHMFLITINSITAVSGIANTIVGGITVNGIQCAWIFGGISILVSTLNILQDKLGYSQNAVIHKKLISQWSSIRMRIEEVLSIPYSARKDCKSVLHFLRTDIRDAEREGSGLVTKGVRDACYEHFKDVDGFELPDICGRVEHTQIYREALLP